jgi:hypothetical protein
MKGISPSEENRACRIPAFHPDGQKIKYYFALSSVNETMGKLADAARTMKRSISILTTQRHITHWA